MRRVAILGGGMSSLTAAWELTRPELGGAFDVTVYQQGWRLGGKGASGRNAKHHQRIEEHGLHVWMGFYENAFRLIREVYRELDRPAGAPLATWQDAFKPHGYIVLNDLDDHGVGHPWPLCFPEQAGTPGDGAPIPSVHEYVPRILSLVVMMLDEHEHTRALVGQTHAHLSVLTTLEELVVRFETLLVLPLGGVEGVIARLLADALQLADHAARALPQELEGLYKKVLALVDRLRAPILSHFDDAELRHTRLLLDFALTHVRGMLADGLLLPPFDHSFSKIDDRDYRQWLHDHGAADDTVRSAPVTALYDLVFAIDKGMAAGATIACATRMLLTYKGALFYKMQAGMGDTVFTPLYEALRRRGVKFRFFHRVDELRLAEVEGGTVVDELVVGRQASVKNGADYDPLVTVENLGCWPSWPNWDQLVEGAALQAGAELPDGGYDLESPKTTWADPLPPVTLRRGQDFDDVVLGISLGALPRITAPLMQRLPQFKEMVEGVKTIATQAMQLWFDTDRAGLGWNDPLDAACAGAAPIAGAYAESHDTWADMTHLLPREAWGPGGPKSIAYFCGQIRDGELPEPTPPTAANWKEAVTHGGHLWMQQHAHPFWPSFVAADGTIDYAKLHSETGAVGPARWAEQYFRANPYGSERYVLTVPGSTKYRLFADDLLHGQPSCANLFLAGDWVRTGINGGCIEAAAMGGMQAARALSGSYFEIVGDTAPFRTRPATQAAFIERGGDVVYAEPYRQTRARLFAFLVPADKQKIAQLCNRYLNWTGRYLFSPIVGHVALIFAAIDNTFSTDPLYVGRGTMTESDVSFWIPVRGSGGSAPPLSWFLPYVWVDNGIAMAAGREVYGFPKEVATLSIPARGAAPVHFAVDTDVIDRFGVPPHVGEAGPRAMTRNVVTVVPSANGNGPTIEGTVGEMLRGLVASVLADRADEAAINWLLGAMNAAVPMLFLKQFRDAADGRRACYKALVLADSTPANITAGGILPGTFDVTVRGFDSHPIVRDLGLGPNPAVATIRGCAGFFVDFDFVMERGRELWRAT